MRVFVDTSAFLALLNQQDSNHTVAASTWRWLVRDKANLYCTNYVVLETLALIQSRWGLDAVRDFQESIAPSLRLLWVDLPLHESGMTALLAANRRQLSLVDCVSFAAARQIAVQTVFAFDKHFQEYGFRPTRAKA